MHHAGLFWSAALLHHCEPAVRANAAQLSSLSEPLKLRLGAGMAKIHLALAS